MARAFFSSWIPSASAARRMPTTIRRRRRRHARPHRRRLRDRARPTGRACAPGRCDSRIMNGLGIARAARASTGVLPPGTRAVAKPRRSGAMRARSRRARTRRPAIGRSPAARCLRLGLFPAHHPGFPPELTDALIARGEAAGHPRQQARLRHRHHRGVRRGAHPHRQADLLHLGRFRASDLRPTRSISGWSGSMRSARSAASSAIALNIGRVIARPFVGERAGAFQAHRQPPGLRRAAAGRHAARPLRREAARRLSASARSPTSSPAAA